MFKLTTKLLILLLAFTFPCGIGKMPNNISNTTQNDFFIGSRKIDVGGYKLYINTKGSGKATIVMDAGLSCPSLAWASIDNEVAKFARVVIYDRAGLGESDPSYNPKTSSVMAEDLHTLLNKAKIKPPYILVGHSFGGVNVRVFAAKYPNEVKGLLLIDPSNEDEFEHLISSLSEDELIKFKKDFEEEECSFEEIKESFEEVKEANKKLNEMPIVVISAGKDQTWNEYEKKLSEVSSKGKYINLEDSRHFVQNDYPEVIINLLKEMVN